MKIAVIERTKCNPAWLRNLCSLAAQHLLTGLLDTISTSQQITVNEAKTTAVL